MLARRALVVGFLSALLGAVAKIDEFLLLFLRQDSGEPLVPALLRNFDFFGLFLRCLVFALLGIACAGGIASLARRFSDRPFEAVFSAVARAYASFLLPFGLTLGSLLSLWISPSYPYGLGLVVSLSLEGAFKILLTAGLFGAGLFAALGAPRLPPRFPWTGPILIVAALVLFTLATPREFYLDGAGQGNMFKYLRMASAMAGAGTLDIEKAQANPDPTFGEFLSHLPRIARNVASEAKALAAAIVRSAARGEVYVGSMKAKRANRSMFRSEEGGIYYINAPGPGLLLVPAYLADRSLNRALGTNRQIAVILFWQLLAALLVYEIYLAASELAGPGASFATALVAALIVPLLFYSFQIYPELPGALLLLHAFRRLVLDRYPSVIGALGSGLALAFLPWLHQKYSVVAFALALLGSSRFIHRRVGRFALEPGKLLLLGLPLVLSAVSIFLYNHALTGSLAPTATFTAAGRTSFAPTGVARGLLGLLFDRENGLFVFAPFYLLALVGWADFASRYPRLKEPILVTLLSYLLVIASFPYWPGAVSTMGRYISSVLPLALLPAAVAVERSFRDGFLAGAVLSLAAASLAMSFSFVKDLVPSWQPDLLWDRVLFCDPVQYLPDFMTEGILGSGRVHFPKLLAQLLFVGALVWLLRDRRLERIESFSVRALCGAGALLALLVSIGAFLERFPGNESEAEKPRFRETRVLGSGRELTVRGEHGFEGEGVWVPGGGSTRFFLLTKEPMSDFPLSFTNGPEENRVEVRERGSSAAILELPPEGPHDRTVLLRKPYRFEGPRGERFLYVFTVRSRGSFVPAETGEASDRRQLGTYVRVRT